MNYSKLAEKFDKPNSLKTIRGFPEQFKNAIERAFSWSIPVEFKEKEYKGILVQGMGGSAIGGLVLRDLVQEKTNIPIVVNRDYSLPNFVNSEWLGIVVSYSGNTEETLSGFKQAKKPGMDIVCVSSNGALAKECEHCLKIPSGFAPRTQLPMTLIPSLALLEKIGLIKEKNNLKKTASFLKKNLKETEKKGRELGELLQGKIPVIYSTKKFSSAAERFHTQLAENSKTMSHWHFFPELNHNEIVGYKPLEKKLGFVLFREPAESEREKKRIDFTKKILRENSSCTELWAKGSSKMEKLFYFILSGDFASYYLALLNGVNPISTKNIDKLKRELKK